MKTKIKWMQDVSFKGSSESGHEVVLDGPKELGGKGFRHETHGNDADRNGWMYVI